MKFYFIVFLSSLLKHFQLMTNAVHFLPFSSNIQIQQQQQQYIRFVLVNFNIEYSVAANS